MQGGETWLGQFKDGGLSRDWDFTTAHIYKIDMDGVKGVLDHYRSYGKPIWVTEFACVDDSGGFAGCTDQDTVTQWIKDVVDLFENDPDVMAYSYTDDGGSGGLGPVWSPSSNGQLTTSGQTYLDAIKQYA